MVRGTAATAIHRIIEALLALFIVPFTLHRLGIEAYGLWTLFYSVTIYLNLADFGFAASLNRHFVEALAKDSIEDRYKVFSTGLAFMLAVGAITLVAGLLLENLFIRFFPEAASFEQSASWVWRALVLVLSIGFLTNYSRSLFFSTHRTASLAILNTILAVLNATTIVIVLSMGWDLIGLAAGAVFVSVVRVSTTFGFGASGVPGLKLGLSGLDSSTLKKMWSFGIKIQVARLADVINQQFDRILLGKVAGLDSVTFYDVGAKGATTANLLPTTAYYVIEPAAAQFSATGEKERFTSLLMRSSKYISLIALGIGAFILVAADPLLNLWLGSPPNPNMTLAIRFLIIAYIAWTLSVPLRLCARGAGFPGWEAQAASIQALLNIVLSISLYYVFGFIGVLTGTLIAALTGQIIMTSKALTGLEQPAWLYLRTAWISPLLVSGIAGTGSWLFLKMLAPIPSSASRMDTILPLLVASCSFIIIFIILTLLLGVLKRDEISNMLHYFTKKSK